MWDQRQFEHTNSSPSCLGGGSGSLGGGGDEGGGARKPRKYQQSGKKKGRTRGVTRKAGEKTREQGGEEADRRAATDESGKAVTTESHEDGIVRCTVPLLSMRLEEKPNWVTSFAAPNPATIAIADTSPVAKILRWRGCS